MSSSPTGDQPHYQWSWSDHNITASPSICPLAQVKTCYSMGKTANNCVLLCHGFLCTKGPHLVCRRDPRIAGQSHIPALYSPFGNKLNIWSQAGRIWDAYIKTTFRVLLCDGMYICSSIVRSNFEILKVILSQWSPFEVCSRVYVLLQGKSLSCRGRGFRNIARKNSNTYHGINCRPNISMLHLIILSPNTHWRWVRSSWM